MIFDNYLFHALDKLFDHSQKKYGLPGRDAPPINDTSADKETKVCRYSKCGINHSHNNACCSANHYKLWRAEQKRTKS